MTYGAPTGLDLSACSVSLDGGKTTQTLAQLSGEVAASNTAITSAVQTAGTANTTATSALTEAQSAVSTVKNAVPTSAVGAVSGVAGINAGGGVVVPPIAGSNANLNFGGGDSAPIGDNNGATISYTFKTKGSPTDYLNNASPDGSGAFARFLAGKVLTGLGSGTLSIGWSSQPIAAVYSTTAAIVTSDATTKTVNGKLSDSSYALGQKLVAALATVQPTIYKLNTSIAEKGADKARYHVGYIAQDVEAALAAAGLSPAEFALWTNSAQFTATEKDGQLTQVATVDGAGNQQYIQMLRYEEIFPVILAGLTASVENLVSRVAALEAKGGA